MRKPAVIILNVAVIAVICVALIWGNTYYRQRTQFLKGEESLAKGDYIAAIAGFESAIHMYTPGSSLVEKSAERLWSMAEKFERGGDWRRALITYQALRSSYYSARGFSVPGTDWISRCDLKIEGLKGKNIR
jgi:hypothetical protein